ncbi:MAG: hypothetical protein HYZ09_02015 [Candidatus Kerfeldbacteria bacterium]|nr:hypothetical protein [Candidatus Kerfeldbacteria bacterium]
MRSAFAILLIPILMVSSFVLLLLRAVDTSVLDGDFMAETLRKNDPHAMLRAIARQQIDQAELPIPYVTKQELFDLLVATIRAPWLNEQLGVAIHALRDWFDAPVGSPLSLAVDLRDPKEHLTTNLTAFIERKAAALPACTPTTPEGELCLPPGTTSKEFVASLSDQGLDLAKLIESLPNTIDLARPTEQLQAFVRGEGARPNEFPDLTEQLRPAQEAFQRAHRIIGGAWLMLAGLFALELALTARGRQRFLAWLGVVLVCVSVLPLVAGLLSPWAYQTFVVQNLHVGPEAPVELQDFVVRFLEDVRQAIFGSLLLWGALAGIVGLALIIDAKVLMHPRSARR